jgi:ATP-dependent helicase/nuclease subunit A
MAERIHRRLADWVRLPTPALRKDLFALGEDGQNDELVKKARTLFASVLDARGGGLRIQTIHSFCQTLLSGFPSEIGLTPGFRAMETREENVLAQHVLSEMVTTAQTQGRLAVIEALRLLVLRLSEDKTREYLMACARAPDAMEALGSGVEANVRVALGLPISDIMPFVLAGCTEGGYPEAALTELIRLNVAWGTGRGLQRSEKINEWLAMPSHNRVTGLPKLALAWTKGDGTLNLSSGWVPKDPDYVPLAETLFSHFNGLIELCNLSKLASDIASALTLGQEYARAYTDAKRAAGLVDFDDLIRKTLELLKQDNIGPWIRYKLDQSTDHILIDEAQDTNAKQWAIIEALTEEFYAGDGAKGQKVRTMFTVGDYKQAIFGFQGTDPAEFAAAQARFAKYARAIDRDMLQLSLNESFRSSAPILEAVDAVIDAVGPERFGLDGVAPRHVSAPGGKGSVTLWPPTDQEIGDPETEDAEDWINESQRVFAKDLAKKVKGWLDSPPMLNSTGELLQPKDILILVRSRGSLAQLIVARLYAAGVPVAGLDRLRLNAPLAVRDLLSCIRFVLQPGDELNLAALLVSPIIGWTQDELYDRVKGRASTLWRHIKDGAPEPLKIMLEMTDRITPYRFLEMILSGGIDARRKLIARMGNEVRDPIEELLNAALSFERDATPSLQQFLDWFDRGDVDIKRESSGRESAVRVMTVHGAKGLQAPIVVLADATRDPKANRKDRFEWEWQEGVKLPLFRPRVDEIVEPLITAVEAEEDRELREHWRLLYVAMTRAEEQLFVGGALSRPQAKKGELSPDCWHSAVAQALGALGGWPDADGTIHYWRDDPSRRPSRYSKSKHDVATVAVPDWLYQKAPEEARPPRPLTPSSLGSDDVSEQPPNAAMKDTAERGRILHSLFERLPETEPSLRERAALSWLEHSAGIADHAARAEFVADALKVIGDSAFGDVFMPDALAEAPIAGVIDGQVISGIVDRLIVTDNEVLVVDFKTGRRVPNSPEACARSHLRQMTAYASVLKSIFPNHVVRAGLLYTSGPVLHILPDDIMEAHKPPYAD